MDPSTLIGLVAAWAAIIIAQILDGGNPAVLFSHIAPLLIVFGGGMSAGYIGFGMKDTGTILKSFKIALLPPKRPDSAAAVEQLMKFADAARREGLLALESQAKEVDDKFLRRGLELVIDGTDPDLVREVLEADLAALKERHKVGAAYMTQVGGYAPTLGIVGTVMGLIHVLENLDKPDMLGPAIAAAFLATLWGVASSNVIFLPMGAKLKRVSAIEVAYRELVLEGLLAIQAGASPRAVGERLKSYLAPSERDGIGGKKAAES